MVNKKYIDEIVNLIDGYDNKLHELENRVERLEKNSAKEIKLFETITCPYCNSDFEIEHDETAHEITCPKCDGLIELDWGKIDDDM